jgi:hypothetical protein
VVQVDGGSIRVEVQGEEDTSEVEWQQLAQWEVGTLEVNEEEEDQGSDDRGGCGCHSTRGDGSLDGREAFQTSTQHEGTDVEV